MIDKDEIANMQELKDEITSLMGFETNLSTFTFEDLLSTRDDLLSKKRYLKEETIKWFDDELYDKLKK